MNEQPSPLPSPYPPPPDFAQANPPAPAPALPAVVPFQPDARTFDHPSAPVIHRVAEDHPGRPTSTSAVSPWARLGAHLLEALLCLVTFGIGWLIWAAMIAGNGQTPAKRLLGLQVVAADTLRPIGMGRMFWVRGFVAGLVASFAIPLTIGVLLFMPFWDRNNQNLWDKVSNTYVVHAG